MQSLTWLLSAIFTGQTTLARRNLTIMFAVTLYATFVAVLDQEYIGHLLTLHPELHTMLGMVLGLFLAFRTGTAYDRWWEGRKLWGQLVNDSRNLSIKVSMLPKVSREEKQRLGQIIIAFTRALKDHLREGTTPRLRASHPDMMIDADHVPAYLAGQVRATVSTWRDQGLIDGYDDLLLDVHSRSLMDVCGACERIRKTPLARSYLHFIRQSISLYLLTLPWGLVDNWYYWAIPATAIIGYFMIGIELIAEEVEEPFGRSEDDLGLDDICDGIEKSVNEILAAPAR